MEEFLEKLKKDALFLKVKSKNDFGGAVQVDDVLNVLNSISKSYKNFIRAEYSKINDLQERKKLEKIMDAVLDENQLLIVDLEFASFGMQLVTNTQTYSKDLPKVPDVLDFKRKKFEKYQRVFITQNINSEKALSTIEREYTIEERKLIMEPLIKGFMDNPKISCSYSNSSTKTLKKINEITAKSISRLIPDSSLNSVQDFLMDAIPNETIIAKVEILKSGRQKVLELFNEKIKDIYKEYKEITFNGIKYHLKGSISAKIYLEDNLYHLQNEYLGILAFGSTLDEAELNFAEQFDYIYNEYQQYSDDELSETVKQIRDYLKFIVIP